MYRDFIAKHARHLALVGYVKNNPDFKVEIVAQGYADKLEKFLEHVHKGPFLAKVSGVQVEWRAPGEIFREFEWVM